MGHEPLEQCDFSKWLKEEMESSREDGDLTTVGRVTGELGAMQ